MQLSRWKVLPLDQRELIKAYIVNVIVRYSSDEQTLQRTKLHLGKLNLILVQVFAVYLDPYDACAVMIEKIVTILA
jgi:hypothetical protein